MIDNVHTLKLNGIRKINLFMNITDNDKRTNSFMLIPDESNNAVESRLNKTHHIKENIVMNILVPFGA